MSVAFTKEEDSEAAASHLPDRPISPHPNFVTAAGLAKLDASLASAKEAVALVQANLNLKNDRSAMARGFARFAIFWCAARKRAAT